MRLTNQLIEVYPKDFDVLYKFVPVMETKKEKVTEMQAQEDGTEKEVEVEKEVEKPTGKFKKVRSTHEDRYQRQIGFETLKNVRLSDFAAAKAGKNPQISVTLFNDAVYWLLKTEDKQYLARYAEYENPLTKPRPERNMLRKRNEELSKLAAASQAQQATQDAENVS